MVRAINLPHLPADGHMEFGEDPDGFDRFWGLILSMAVRDRAISVHWHPWRAEDALGYIVDGTRYSLLMRPSAEFDCCISAAARDLVAPRELHSFARRSRYLGPHIRVLFGWWLRRSVAGRFRCISEYGPTEWAGVWWHVDGQAGAEFHRLDIAVNPITSRIKDRQFINCRVHWGMAR
jgi:hypothetical protein